MVATSNASSTKTQAALPRQERTFRPDVEGLRAIAVVLVLLDHAGLTLLNGGYVGVDVFFVLSGFLITGLLLKEIERTGSVSLPQFYARRARRLLPAGTLVLVVTVLASAYYLGDVRAARIADDARWSALFASNFRFIEEGTDYLNATLPPSPLQHYWSLAVEEQFYVVWPAVMMLVAIVGRRVSLRLKLGVVLGGVIVASLWWSHHQTALDGTTAYFSPFPRASELAAGAFLAVVAHRLPGLPRLLGVALSWGGVAGILAIGFLFDATTVFPGLAVALPVAATVAVVAGGTIAPGGGAEIVLRQAPFQWIGKLSYSLYLWHWPVLVIAAGRAGHDLSVGENLLLCLAALGLSATTYQLLENPVRNAGQLRQRSPWVSVGIGVALVLVSFGVADRFNDTRGLPVEDEAAANAGAALPSSDDVIRAVADAVALTSLPPQPPRAGNPAYSKACNVTRRDTTSSMCVHGDQNGNRTAVIYGDSHAAMWVPALDLIGKSNGWRIVQLTKPACQVPDFPIYSNALKREYTECEAYRTFALEQLATIQPELVMISSAFKDVSVAVDGKPSKESVEEAWANGLTSMLQRIAPLTDRIIVLGDMAYPAEPGIDCLTAHPDDIAACNTPRSDAVLEAHNHREREVALANGAEYLDTIPWLCTDTVCPAVVGGLPTHRDDFHIGENYVIWLAAALGRATGLMPENATLTAPAS